MPDPVVPEPPKPADPPAPAPVVAPAPAEPPVVAAPVEPAPAPAPDWRDKRIAELTHKLNSARTASPPPAPVVKPGESEAEFQARVDAAAASRAVEIAAQTEWDRRCNESAALGAKEFPDFDSRLAACKAVMNPADPVEGAQFNSVIAAALETGAAHKLVHALGATPGEVKRLMGLSPVKMGVELALMAAKLTAPTPAEEPSNAPKPIEPLGSHGIHYDGIKPDDPVNGMKLSAKQWFAMREKQAVERGIQ